MLEAIRMTAATVIGAVAGFTVVFAACWLILWIAQCAAGAVERMRRRR